MNNSIEQKCFFVLSGASSPFCRDYVGTYSLIEEIVLREDLGKYNLLDYEGVGQFYKSNSSEGIEINSSVERVKNMLRTASPGSLLMCRSWGCFVFSRLMAINPEYFKNFSRIILWGPSSYDFMINHYGTTKQIDDQNSKSSSKFYRVSRSFPKTLNSIEAECLTWSPTNSIQIDVGFGTRDRYLDKKYAESLVDAFNKQKNVNSSLYTVPNAYHDVQLDRYKNEEKVFKQVVLDYKKMIANTH